MPRFPEELIILSSATRHLPPMAHYVRLHCVALMKPGTMDMDRGGKYNLAEAGEEQHVILDLPGIWSLVFLI